MKKIGIDARLYFQTGVGVYTRNLLNYLLKTASGDVCFYVYVMKEDSEKILFDSPHVVKREVTARWHSIAEQGAFLHTLNKDTLDLMHFTYFSYPVLYKRSFLATIHDVTPLQFKTGKASTKNRLWYELKHTVFKYVLKTQATNAQRLITPTHTVKAQLAEVFGEDITHKTEAIYEGVDTELLQTQENSTLLKQFLNPFFVYIGNFYPHKNVERLIRAYAQTSREEQLLLVGPASFFSERLMHIIKELGQEQRILFYHNAKNEDLVFFYKHAQALINPSLSEGFGLPLIEALHFNLPIIASEIAVFKELLDHHYTSFKPESIESMRNVLETYKINKNKPTYETLKLRYSFQQMSQQTRAIYDEILNNPVE